MVRFKIILWQISISKVVTIGSFRVQENLYTLNLNAVHIIIMLI